ncbi:MAG TPA: ATP-binding protein [bacterium]|nr:ATP-binding protein [bacterium]HQO90958.1 ATP-binding protein [bacterium]
MKRTLMKELVKWKDKPDRKPLLIQGARQVGKTWLIKEFGRLFYENTVYLNFEEKPELRKLFEKSLSADYLIEQISLFFGFDISKQGTLIVFDEIQTCPDALTSLKYFDEQRPDLHIVSAGSLLGVSLSRKTPFPVGKVNFLTLHSLSFYEFIFASGNEILADYLENISEKTTSSVVHDQLLELFRKYLFIGGMPEVVKSWVDSKDPQKVREIQNEIIKAYQNDFSKYSSPAEAIKIAEVWKTIPSILSKENKKFKYSDITPSARASTYRTAIEWLEKAGLINLSYCIKVPKFPLSGYADNAVFKTYFHDVGLLGAMLSVPSKIILEKDALFNEYNGAFVENFTASEFLRSGDEELFYWSSNSDAEIDFIAVFDRFIIPFEVKSGYSKRKKSLQSYNAKYSPKHLIRFSPREFDDAENFLNIPIYEAGFWKKRLEF